MARPRGEIAQAVVQILSSQPMAARSVSALLSVPVPMVVDVCRRLCRAGDIGVVRRERLPGARRPLAVYGLPTGVAYHS